MMPDEIVSTATVRRMSSVACTYPDREMPTFLQVPCVVTPSRGTV